MDLGLLLVYMCTGFNVCYLSDEDSMYVNYKMNDNGYDFENFQNHNIHLNPLLNIDYYEVEVMLKYFFLISVLSVDICHVNICI